MFSWHNLRHYGLNESILLMRSPVHAIPRLSLAQLGPDLAQDRQIDETIHGNFGGNAGFLSDLVDDGLQHRLFDIAVGIDDLPEDLEGIGGNLRLQREIFLQIRMTSVSFLTRLSMLRSVARIIAFTCSR